MRGYSKVSPRIWTGKLGVSIRGEHMTQLLAIYLATNQHCNMLGLYHLPISYAAEDLGCKPQVIVEGLARLEELGYCRYDEETRRVWVVEYLRHELDGHQLKSQDNRHKTAIQLLEEHSCSELSKALVERYGLEWEAPSEPLVEPLVEPLQSPPRSQEQEQEQEQEQLHVGPVGPTPRDLVGEVWEAHLEAREAYFRWKNGTPPPTQPSLTSKLRALIRQAIKEHGFEKARDAGRGIFWSDHHIGKNDSEKEYLAPEICWRMSQKVDNVHRFSELAAQERSKRRASS